MAERLRLWDYLKQGKRIRQLPPFPWDALNRPGLYVLNRPVLRWQDPNPKELQRNSTRVFITGHAVDHNLQPGWDPRFPDTDSAINLARERIHKKLEDIYEIAQSSGKHLELVFCSATTGTDLLGLQWVLGKIKEAEANGVKPHITVRSFLGYDKETFIKDSVILKDHTKEHQDMWFKIFNELDSRGLVIEPEFRGFLRRRRNPRPPANAPRGHRFRDQIRREGIRRYGADERGSPLYKHFDEMNDMMVRYLRKSDYAIALWDGSEPFGRGGTVYAINAAAKRIRNKLHIEFIDPHGIINPKKLINDDGTPKEISLSRVRELVAQRR